MMGQKAVDRRVQATPTISKLLRLRFIIIGTSLITEHAHNAIFIAEVFIKINSMMQCVLRAVILTMMLLVHDTDALSGPEACSESEIGAARLTGLNSSFVGYVQICKNGHWRAVSFEGEEWTKKNAVVTCRELGFQGVIKILSQDRFHTTRERIASAYHFACTGLEKRLTDCTKSASVDSNDKDAVVLCKKGPPDGDIAIVGISSKDNEGVVVVYNSARMSWSVIHEWDDRGATVACQQLGYRGGSKAKYNLNDEWMNSTGLLTSDHIFKCTGSEDQLSDCKHTSKYFPRGSYAGVICTTEAKDINDPAMKMIISLLVLLIVVFLVLILVLLVVLRYTLKRFKKKPSSAQTHNRSSIRGRQAENERPRITHTQLNHEIPYLPLPIVAPPTYEDTLLADERVQTTALLVDDIDQTAASATDPEIHERMSLAGPESEESSSNVALLYNENNGMFAQPTE